PSRIGNSCLFDCCVGGCQTRCYHTSAQKCWCAASTLPTLYRLDDCCLGCINCTCCRWMVSVRKEISEGCLIIALVADVIGEFLATILEIHTAHMPIFYMIIYQYFTKWKTFLIAITIMAFIFAFILEPL